EEKRYRAWLSWTCIRACWKYRRSAKDTRRVGRVIKTNICSPVSIGLIYTSLGQNTQAFEWVEKAYAAQNEWMNWWKVAPEVDILRSDPRFTDLLKRLNLTSNK